MSCQLPTKKWTKDYDSIQEIHVKIKSRYSQNVCYILCPQIKNSTLAPPFPPKYCIIIHFGNNNEHVISVTVFKIIDPLHKWRP